MGGNLVATLKEHLEQSDVTEATGKESTDEMVETVVKDFDKIMKSLKKGMNEAAKDEDDMTEDLLNAVYQSIEKHQWMLNAYLGDTNK